MVVVEECYGSPVSLSMVVVSELNYVPLTLMTTLFFSGGSK